MAYSGSDGRVGGGEEDRQGSSGTDTLESSPDMMSGVNDGLPANLVLF